MQEVINKIKSARSMALLPHVNEDPDALGSCFAFAAAMRSIGKEAVCYTEDDIEDHLKFMGGEYTIYNPEISLAERHDLCVCLDCGDLGRVGARSKIFDEIGNSVNIDHHYTNTHFADANLVDGDAAATSEILTSLFKAMEIELNDEIARYLYIAICSDTGCFKFSNVRPKTMRAAAELLEHDIKHEKIARLLFDTYSRETLLLRSEIVRNLHSYADGRIQVALVDDSMFEKCGANVKDAPNLVEIPRSIAGTEIAVCIKHQNGVIRASIRSNGDADVSKAALVFGGGGHTKASGCTISAESFEEAERLLVAECVKQLP